MSRMALVSRLERGLVCHVSHSQIRADQAVELEMMNPPGRGDRGGGWEPNSVTVFFLLTLELYCRIFERFGVELQQKGMPTPIRKAVSYYRYNNLSSFPELLIRYHEHVHAVVKPESKLLTMELKQGWLPLATFLGKPVPQQTFPKYNERKSFGQEAKRIIITSILAWVAILSSAGLLAWGVCRVCKSQVSVA